MVVAVLIVVVGDSGYSFPTNSKYAILCQDFCMQDARGGSRSFPSIHNRRKFKVE